MAPDATDKLIAANEYTKEGAAEAEDGQSGAH